MPEEFETDRAVRRKWMDVGKGKRESPHVQKSRFY